MKNLVLLYQICFVIATFHAARAETPCQSTGLSRHDKCYRIDTRDPGTQGLRQTVVVSGDRVYVEIARRPTEKCVLQTKVEPVAPPAGAGTFFKILSGAVIPAAAAGETDTCKLNAARDPMVAGRARSPEVVTFDADSDSLFSLLSSLKERVKTTQQVYIDVAKELIAFQSCKDGIGSNANDFCSDHDLFVAAQATMHLNIDNVLSGPIPSSSVVDFQLQKLQDDLKAITDPVWFANKGTQLSCYAGSVAGIKARLADLSTFRQQFVKAGDLIRSMTWLPVELKLIPPQKNAKATETLTCTNVISSDPSVDPVTLVINYNDVPRTTVDAGVLVSLIPKQVIGTKNVKTGESDGIPTFKSVFAITDNAPAQAIPFSFANLRVHYWRLGSHIIAASLSGGIGVNPNSGTKEAEFFAGSGFSIGNLSFHFGAHFGEFKNLGGGFQLGETVPANFGSVPVNKGYTIHPAFALSYRLPLP